LGLRLVGRLGRESPIIASQVKGRVLCFLTKREGLASQRSVRENTIGPLAERERKKKI